MEKMKLKVFLGLDKIPAFLWFVIKASLVILIFSFFLLKQPSNLLGLLGFSLRVDLWPVIPIATIILYLLFRIPGRLGEALALGGTMFLFVMPLAGLWASGHTQTSVISGLIQLNDARSYYMDALRLTIGEDYSFFSTRRPLFTGFLSVLLMATNNNLMITLVVLSAITAISCYWMTREVQRTNGTETAVFLLIMLFLYYRLHSGITMSENFGIALGTLGFTILWRGTVDKKIWWITFGIFTTTLALNARAGAFFVLPLLVLWAGWLFRESKHISWQAIFIACGAIVLGFFCNLMLGRLIGQPGGIPFANFSYTLYSLAAGGKSWAYISEVHPEVFLLPEPEHTKRSFQLAFELMRENPWQTVQGAVFFWKAIFTNTLYNVFAFTAKENWVLNPLIKWGLYLLSLTGIFTWFKDRKSSLNSLVIACIVGIFISVPFAPPTDSFRMRPYASSIAMISILPALGFGYLVDKFRRRTSETPIGEESNRPIIHFSLALILVTLIAPIMIRYGATAPSVTSRACKSNTVPVVVSFTEGSYIKIIKNTNDQADWPPNYHAYLFQKNAHSLEDVNLIAWLESIDPSNAMFVALDIINKVEVWLLLPTQLLPKHTGYVQFCGTFEEDPALQRYSIFNVSETHPLQDN